MTNQNDDVLLEKIHNIAIDGFFKIFCFVKKFFEKKKYSKEMIEKLEKDFDFFIKTDYEVYNELKKYYTVQEVKSRVNVDNLYLVMYDIYCKNTKENLSDQRIDWSFLLKNDYKN